MRAITLTFSALLLAGCATGYQPESFTGGFSETQFDTNIFRVSFRGNGYTSMERAEELALLRSAELTLANGFTHFVIIDGYSQEDLSTHTAPTESYTNMRATAYGSSAYGTAHTTTFGGHTYVVSKPRTTNTIVCFNGKPDIQAFVFDAQFICESLGKKYDVICNGE